MTSSMLARTCRVKPARPPSELAIVGRMKYFQDEEPEEGSQPSLSEKSSTSSSAVQKLGMQSNSSVTSREILSPMLLACTAV